MIFKAIMPGTLAVSLALTIPGIAAANTPKPETQSSVERLKAQLAAEDRLEKLRQERYTANRRLKEIAIEEMQIREEAGLSAETKQNLEVASLEPVSKAKKTEVEGTQTKETDVKKDTKKTAEQGKSETPADDGNGGDSTGDGEKNKFNTKFGGIEFGAGIGFSYDLGSNDRVVDAMLDENGIVRISKSNNVQARLMLESHYFFTPTGWNLFGLKNEGVKTVNGKTVDGNKWGMGPFVTIQPGGNNLIEAVGGGLMFGLRRSDKTSESFNIGFGVLYDINSKTLGDGIMPDEPLPAGETEIRFREQSQSGFLIMSSYSF